MDIFSRIDLEKRRKVTDAKLKLVRALRAHTRLVRHIDLPRDEVMEELYALGRSLDETRAALDKIE